MRYLTIYKIYCLATEVLYTHHVVLLQRRLLNYIAKPKRQFTSAFFSCL